MLINYEIFFVDNSLTCTL